MAYTFAVLFCEGTYADLIEEYGILVTGSGRDRYGPYEEGVIRNLRVKTRGKGDSDMSHNNKLFEYFGSERDIREYNSELEPEIRKRNEDVKRRNSELQKGIENGSYPAEPPSPCYAVLGTVQIQSEYMLQSISQRISSSFRRLTLPQQLSS